MEAWLHKAHATVQECAGNGSKDVLKERLDTVNMVAERIPEGECVEIIAGVKVQSNLQVPTSVYSHIKKGYLISCI